MRIKNRYSVESSKEIRAQLEQLKIPYKELTVFNPILIQFHLYSDDPRKEIIDKSLFNWNMIIPELVFSGSEYERANLFRFMPKFDKIPSCDDDYTYSFFCKKNNNIDYCSTHRYQIGYYRLDKKPRLPSDKKCIYSSEGNYDHIWFTNNITRAIFENSDIHGIHFDPVLRRQDDQPWPNIQQIIFDKIIPEDAIVLGKENGIDNIVSCDGCREKRYYVSPQTYQLCLHDGYVGDDDVYVTKAIFGQGFGYHMVIGSQNFYQFLRANNMLKYFNIHPVKILS